MTNAYAHLDSRRAWLAAPLLGLLLVLLGCAGGGRVELVSLDFRSVDPPAPKTSTLDFDRCFWWNDDAGNVWVAMDCVRHPLLGSLGPFKFEMSLALDQPPAGRARNYNISDRSLRAVARFGPMESRFVSITGVVAVYRESGDRLRGSYRLHVRGEMARLLGGWQAPASYAMEGTFDAVPDRARGELIAADTEASGWERAGTASAQSSSAPSSE